MRRKIGLISEHASPLAILGGVDSGGQNVYVGQLASRLGDMGYMVDIFTRWDNPELPQIVNWSKDVRIIHVPAGPLKYIPKEDLLPFMSNFTDFMLDFIRREGEYDLIHANFWMSALVAADIKLILNIPFVVTFHALGWVRRIYQKTMDKFPDERFAIENRVVNETDYIIAECPQDKEDLKTYYHAKEEKIAVIPCGFDGNEFYPVDKSLARMKLGLRSTEKIILQVGRLVPRKGIDNVVRGFGVLRNLYQIDAKLIIVGGESEKPDPIKTPEIGRLQRIARDEGVEKYVLFAGSKAREDLKFYYSAADIFITTPWYEPFGITPIESMACGTPVIGSNVGGIKYTVENGKTGYLIKPNDSLVLGRRLYYLYQHPKLLKLLGEQAFLRANNKFSWNLIANEISTLYEDTISQRSKTEDESIYQLNIIDKSFEEAAITFQKSVTNLRIPILDATKIILSALKHGRKVLVCGNGGSATDASHFAAELVGKYKIKDRAALPILSLNENTATITAWSNDVGYKEVFSRQVEAYGQAGDILIGISTSGMSENLIKAFKQANYQNMICISFLGKNGGELLNVSDCAIVVPSMETSRIQEVHIHIIHTICDLVEKQLTLSNISESENNFITEKTDKYPPMEKRINKGGHGYAYFRE